MNGSISARSDAGSQGLVIVEKAGDDMRCDVCINQELARDREEKIRRQKEQERRHVEEQARLAEEQAKQQKERYLELQRKNLEAGRKSIEEAEFRRQRLKESRTAQVEEERLLYTPSKEMAEAILAKKQQQKDAYRDGLLRQIQQHQTARAASKEAELRASQEVATVLEHVRRVESASVSMQRQRKAEYKSQLESQIQDRMNQRLEAKRAEKEQTERMMAALSSASKNAELQIQKREQQAALAREYQAEASRKREFQRQDRLTQSMSQASLAEQMKKEYQHMATVRARESQLRRSELNQSLQRQISEKQALSRAEKEAEQRFLAQSRRTPEPQRVLQCPGCEKCYAPRRFSVSPFRRQPKD